MVKTPLQILQQYWKFDSFRPHQLEIIESVLMRQDTFALLPTGGGKSICFQVPALVKDGICIVISPLIALMEDQVKQLKEKGIKSIALPSGIRYDELDTLLDNCIYGNYKFLYLSPERLQQDIVQDRIRQMNVNMIAVDEAHCISQWGNDFRPSYKKIQILREIHPSVPIIALTASATSEVVEDIIKELDLFNPQLFKSSFYRSNLGYHIEQVLDKNYKITQLLKQYPGSSIIYVRNRKSAIELSDFLNSSGYTATYYHGGVSSEEKTKRYQQWFTEEIKIMVATNAFGMGIDKPNVRTVIHYNIPESIESYFQEAGRAGRDGKTAHAFLLKNKNDIQRLTNQFIKVLPDSEAVKFVYRKLCNYFQISYGEGQQSIHDFNFNEFCKTYQLHNLVTYNTLQFLDRCSIIRFNQRFLKKSTIHILISGNELLDYLEKNSKYELVTKAILRTYSGIFDEEVAINLSLISSRSGVNEKEIITTLKSLNDAGIIEFEHIVSDAEIVFLVPREDDRTINSVKHHLTKQNSSKVKKVNAMITFTENNTICKSIQLLHYFGEEHATECGICSFCTSKRKKIDSPNLEQIQKEIITLLKQKDLSSRDLTHQLPYPEQLILEVLREMNAFHIIKINQNNNYQLL